MPHLDQLYRDHMTSNTQVKKLKNKMYICSHPNIPELKELEAKSPEAAHTLFANYIQNKYKHAAIVDIDRDLKNIPEYHRQ